MVPIVQNWADIEGNIDDVRPSEHLPDFVTARIAVKRVNAVQGMPNLFAGTSGTTLEVNIPADLVRKNALHKGQVISLRVRKGGPDNAFAHPDSLRVQHSDSP
jgi:hypothetical protein